MLSSALKARPFRRAAFLGLGVITLGTLVFGAEERLGKWLVHDMTRPRPPVVTPGTFSTADQVGKAPSDAIVLFDGKDTSQFEAGGKPAPWKVADGYMEGAGTNITTKEAFGDVQLHVEWSEPTPAKGESQGRGNSGVIFMSRYEIQVLDTYKNDTYPDGQCGSVYGQNPPLVNACRPPGEWQAYDIVFHAPKFEGKELKFPGNVTVFQNGVLVQDHWTLKGRTLHGQLPSFEPHPDKLPLELQFHGNAVRFRNVWIRPLEKLEEENGAAREDAGYQPKNSGKAE